MKSVFVVSLMALALMLMLALNPVLTIAGGQNQPNNGGNQADNGGNQNQPSSGNNVQGGNQPDGCQVGDGTPFNC